MKSLYDEKYRQTKEGQELYQKTQEVIGNVFRNFVYKGYSPHEISAIICESVTMLKMHVILEQESYKAQQVAETNTGEKMSNPCHQENTVVINGKLRAFNHLYEIEHVKGHVVKTVFEGMHVMVETPHQPKPGSPPKYISVYPVESESNDFESWQKCR